MKGRSVGTKGQKGRRKREKRRSSSMRLEPEDRARGSCSTAGSCVPGSEGGMTTSTHGKGSVYYEGGAIIGTYRHKGYTWAKL